MNIKHFDFLTLSVFLRENIEFLAGARIQKIQQPTRREIIFGMRNQGQSRKFYVNISPQFFHACFMAEQNEKKRYIEIPKHPPMFCMLLRKYLEGAKIAKVHQPEGERILEFYFETYDETGEKIYLCLAIELMGKHSNVILYNYDTNVIIGCAHNVGSDKSRERELIGGLPYTYPPKHNLSALNNDQDIYPPKSMNRNFFGFYELLKSEINVNEQIDSYFANLQQQQKTKEVKSKLFSFVNARLKKIEKALEKIQKQSSKSEDADFYRKNGDLIMANLYQGKDFCKSIELIDYETNQPLKIKLDEKLSLKENAQVFYKLYNKAKTSNLKSQEMIENIGTEKQYFEQVLYSVEEADNIEDLFEIQEEVGILKEQKKQKTKEFNILSKKIDGFNVYIGKNNKQNDYIVSKLARDQDLWFHTHNIAGSHVLLRIESGQTVNDKIIFECAKLAKEYSSAKDSSKVGVIYTKAKNLKKPPGANPGYVIYKNEHEIIID